MGKIKALFLCLTIQISLYGQTPDLAKTPPMGWNSWNAFALEINSKIVKSVADSMVSKGLAAAGYQYIVIDDGWQISRDQDGKIIADSARFPEGIKYLADYVHSKGLKFGIYTCCGTKTCGGRPGSYNYEAIDAKTYAEWGVDYIKEDWCSTDGLDTHTQYKIMSDAIRATGRPMILSLCEWGVSSPWEWANGVGAMWRTTMDIQDCFDCEYNWGGSGWARLLDKNGDLAPFAGPGHWNDPDMLEVGNKALTVTECRSHFAMWCMLAAPLIAGNNISTMDNTIRDILTAPEIIAIDQDPLGIQGMRIKNKSGLQVWQKPLSDGSIAVALLNLSAAPASISVALDEIGFKNGVKSSVRDLWNRNDLAAISNAFTANVESHGVVVVKIKGVKAAATMLAFEKSKIDFNKGNHTFVRLTVHPANTPIKVLSSDESIVSPSLSGVNSYKLTAKKEGKCILTATTADGKLHATCTVRVAPSNIPAPWNFTEIKVDNASATYGQGIFSLESGGADIWGASDQCTFLNCEARQDQSISGRILSQSNSDPWAKSGLMFRENLESQSSFVMLCVTPGNGMTLQWRESIGSTCSSKVFKTVTLPSYIKLTKSGPTFSAYQSNDGIQWNLLGDVKLEHSFSETYRLGVAVSAHSSHNRCLTKIDHVKIESTQNNTK